MKGGQIGGFRWGLYGSAGGFPGASALIVRHSCKFSRFRLPCAIAFPRSFNKSVLRAFLGGFFGFMGFRCIFGCLVAFVGLVGLYACNVRRLRTEKRKTRKFIGFIGLLCSFSFLYCYCFACLDCFALVVCWSWVSFPSDDCDKKKGRNFLRPL